MRRQFDFGAGAVGTEAIRITTTVDDLTCASMALLISAENKIHLVPVRLLSDEPRCVLGGEQLLAPGGLGLQWGTPNPAKASLSSAPAPRTASDAEYSDQSESKIYSQQKRQTLTAEWQIAAISEGRRLPRGLFLILLTVSARAGASHQHLEAALEQPRLWWQAVQHSDWAVFSLSDDLARDRWTALLAALERLSTRGPMADLDEITAEMREIGFHAPLSAQDLRSALERLAGDGLAEPFRDYTIPVRNYQGLIIRQEAWALTRRGRTVVAAVRDAVLDVGRALQLPSRLLDSIATTIREIIRHFAEGDDTAHVKEGRGRGLLPMDLDDVRTRIGELQRVTADFYAALGQLVQADVTNDMLFGANRDRVIEALRQFPREYERAFVSVEKALADLERVGHRQVAEAAVAHAGLIDARDQHHWVEERVRLLSALGSWFAPEGTVQQLISSASGAVYTLLIAIDRRYSARRRGSDLGADFHALAQSLHRQRSDEDARRVHAAAFGDWSAWHAVTPRAEEDVAHGTEAAGRPDRHRVEVTLREHERQGRASGRPRAVPDTVADRKAALAKAMAAAERNRRLAELLVTSGEVELSYFAGMGAEAVEALLRAVETALMRLDPVTGTGAHVDGANVLVEIRCIDHGPTARADFAEGALSFWGRDLRLRVTSLEPGASPPIENMPSRQGIA